MRGALESQGDLFVNSKYFIPVAVEAGIIPTKYKDPTKLILKWMTILLMQPKD